MKEMIREIIDYRQLLYMLTWRGIKVRYKQSVMGFMWAILMPMMVVAAGITIKLAFSFASGTSIDTSDIASISVKALPWSFFITSIKFATNSLVGNGNLVSKVYFPRELFPLSSVLACFFDFAIASGALIIILTVMQVGVSIYLLWLPLLILLLVIFTIGVGMFLACTNLFFRDVKYIVEVIVTFAIFFTPVFYDASIFGKWAPLLLLNPVGVFLESINAVTVLHHAPDPFWLTYAAICSVSGLLLSWTVFHRAEYMFAERI